MDRRVIYPGSLTEGIQYQERPGERGSLLVGYRPSVGHNPLE